MPIVLSMATQQEEIGGEVTTFAEYMEHCLYGPAGYYSSGVAQSGKKGDYFTAPDIGPAFGQLLAAIFSGWREKLAVPDFVIIEAGAGEGRLAQDIVSAMTPRPRYVAVEKSAIRRHSLKGLEVYADLNSLEGLTGVLFANELIDAFPVHRVRYKNGQLEELHFDGTGEKRRFVWGDPSTPLLEAYFRRLNISLPQDYETEINLAMAEWLRSAAKVLDKGLVVLIDYGRPAHEYYMPERTRGTLRAFSKHKVSADFLDPAGMVDLTADVDFTSLALDARAAGFEPLAFMELGTFLLQGLQGTLRIAPSPGLKYLLHPEGLGTAFHVLILGKGLKASEWTFDHNRISRLGI